jgi:glucosamine--fructose-6-phosphate aminotransferase (isomerizing)
MPPIPLEVNPMTTSRRLPKWAQQLLDRHPGAEIPTPERPVPDWLEREIRQTPLWALIRGSDGIRQEHPYFLYEDIHRQPELLEGVLRLRPQLNRIVDRLERERIEHVVFTGCGSSFFNSWLGAYIFRWWTGLEAEGVEALEFVNYGLPLSRRAALIVQSATGGSVEVLEATERARREGLVVIGLTNTPDSPLVELCDEIVVYPTGQRCGPDISVITTRLLMLYLIALALGRRRGALSDEPAADLERVLEAIPALARRFLETQDARLAAVAEALQNQRALLLIGGGPNWFSAREGALKIEEESCMLCKAYRPGEYVHDAIALLGPEMTTIPIAPPGPSYARLYDCARTARAARSPVLAVVAEGDATIARVSDHVIPLPAELPEILWPILATILFQLLGYHLGVRRGYNPDTLRTDNLDHARAWLTAFPLGTH